MCAYTTSPPDIDPPPNPVLLKLCSAKHWGSVGISVFPHAHFICNEVGKYYFNFLFHFLFFSAKYLGHLETKERLRIQPVQLFNFS